jgi:hypothetical protein
MDSGNFYLNAPLEIPEYMKFPVWMIPDEIMKAYNLDDNIADGCVHVELCKAVYTASSRLENWPMTYLRSDLCSRWLPTHRAHTSGLWKHDTRPISFTLVIDDFGVKYFNKEDAEHLLETCLSKHYYPMKSDWTGGRYVGIFLNWDYKTVPSS